MNPTREENPTLLDGFRDGYSVHLDKFDGPLDLLLHLIRKNEVDICDIPIADITRQYLDYIKLMKVLNLDVAGDFLLMASTLLHIKSRMLLPPDEEEEGEEEEGDPRAELVRRLLEYQQYKEAGMVIGARALLGREVFARACPEPALAAARAEEGPLEVSLFELVDAFRALLARIPAESFHDVAPGDSLSIADCINEILSLLQDRDTLQFDELVKDELTRERVIVTFLALLELCRLKLIRIFQSGEYGAIWFVPAVVPGPEGEGEEAVQSTA
ncbi:segregation/condensation protein A [Geobacter sp. FeAm09]|uniref:segregation and condensation protein A n=1 Tax=Geobacter sp. FeAm09 TaxID=2597769 RepID=UPI0011EE4526|nr:segregation/condensation protein A [Geobacter sp. FeAm09]QEM68305.1 segregation/condensation protein A [Geobacter sp. FeAm09]